MDNVVTIGVRTDCGRPACTRCPFMRYHETHRFSAMTCAMAPTAKQMLIDEEAPDWCPLLDGPVLVKREA